MLLRLTFTRGTHIKTTTSPVGKILQSCFPDVAGKDSIKKARLIPYQTDDPSDELFKSSYSSQLHNNAVPIIKAPLFLINFKRFTGRSNSSKNSQEFTTHALALLHRFEKFPYKWTGCFLSSLGMANKNFNLQFQELPASPLCNVVPAQVLDEIVFQINRNWKKQRLQEYTVSREGNETEFETGRKNVEEAVSIILQLIKNDYKAAEIPLSLWKKICMLICSMGPSFTSDSLLARLPLSPKLKEMQQEFIRLLQYKNQKLWDNFVVEFRVLEEKYPKNVVYNELFGSLYVDSLERMMKARVYEQECILIYDKCIKRLGSAGQFKLLHVAEEQGLSHFRLHIQSSISSSTGYLKDLPFTVDEYLLEMQNMGVKLDFKNMRPGLLHDFEFLSLKFPHFKTIQEYLQHTKQTFESVTDQNLRYLYVYFLLKNISLEGSFVEFAVVLKKVMALVFPNKKEEDIRLADLDDINDFLSTEKDIYFTLLQNLSKNQNCKITCFQIYQYLKKTVRRSFTIDDYYCLIKANLYGDEYKSSYYYLNELVKQHGHSFVSPDKKSFSLPLKIQRDLIEKRLVGFYQDPEIHNLLLRLEKRFLEKDDTLNSKKITRYFEAADEITEKTIKNCVKECDLTFQDFPRYVVGKDLKHLRLVQPLLQD